MSSTSNPLMASTPLRNASRAVQQAAIPATANEDELAALRSRVKVLEVQLEASNAAFTLQEATMATAMATNANMHAQTAPVGVADTAWVPFAQYRALLELWRRKALQHNVARLHAERALTGALGELKEVRNDLRTCSSTHAAEMLAVKESYEAQCAAAAELVTQLSCAQDALQQETSWRTELEQRVRSYSHSFASMKLILVHHRDVTNSSVLEAQVSLFARRATTFYFLVPYASHASGQQLSYAQAMQRLEALAERVTNAAARVRFASGLVAQKEVNLRNDAAALEAERRLLRLSAAAPSPALVAGSLEDGPDEGPPKFVSRAHDGVSLHPDTEALLRALFLSLDHDDSGAVAVPMLLQCFVPSSAPLSESDSERLLSLSLTPPASTSTAALKSADVATLGGVLREALGEAALQQITGGLRTAAASVTWGEFLLMTIPDPDPAALLSAALSVDELATLRRKRLLLDMDCGVVPLDAKFLGRSASAAATTMASRSAVAHHHHDHHHREEVRRLAAERTLLQARLQEVSAALERRAEGIKGHFEGDLQRARVREGRLASENAALRSQVEAAEARATESDASFKSRMAALAERVDALERENKGLTEALTARKSEEVLRLEQALRAEADKLHRLDIEHNLLQREASKREIRCRGLQRDVLRLQTALAACQQELLAAKDDAAAAERRAREEDAATRRKCEQEESERAGRRQRKDIKDEEPDVASEGARDDDDDAIAANLDAVPTLARQTKPEEPEQSSPMRPVPQQRHERLAPAQATAPVFASVPSVLASAASEAPSPPAPFRLSGHAADIYSAQLSRLLRLAEDTIGNP